MGGIMGRVCKANALQTLEKGNEINYTFKSIVPGASTQSSTVAVYMMGVN